MFLCENILGFLHSHAAIGEKKHVQQLCNSRRGIVLLPQVQHPLICPLASYRHQPYGTSRNISLLQSETLAVFSFPSNKSIIEQTDIQRGV